MKKIITYLIVIAVCIGFCFLFSLIGDRCESGRAVNPWAFTIGVVVVALIMAAVHQISLRHQQKGPHNDPDDPAAEQ